MDSSLHPPFQPQRYISLLLRHREKTPFLLFVQRFLSLMKLLRNLRLGLFTLAYNFQVSAAVSTMTKGMSNSDNTGRSSALPDRPLVPAGEERQGQQLHDPCAGSTMNLPGLFSAFTLKQQPSHKFLNYHNPQL